MHTQLLNIFSTILNVNEQTQNLTNNSFNNSNEKNEDNKQNMVEPNSENTELHQSVVALLEHVNKLLRDLIKNMSSAQIILIFILLSKYSLLFRYLKIVN